MNLNPVEWSQAQELLLQLVQVLSPLAEQPAQRHIILTNRLFVPQKSEDYQPVQSKNPVRILLTLESMQKQVQEWVGEEGEGRVKTTIPPKNPTPPIAMQAKTLLLRVQNAIGRLVSSSNLKDPKQEPLREAMKQLKPDLDRIIQAVAEEGMEAGIEKPNERSFATPYRFVPTPSGRQTRLMAEVKTVNAKVKIDNPKSQIIHETLPYNETSKPQITEEIRAQAKPQPMQPKNNEVEVLNPKLSEETSPLSFSRPSKLSPAIQNEPHVQTKEQKQAIPRPIERTTIPVVPFISESRSLTPVRKKKKKKGFWQREEEDDRKNS